jgi:hypothetical protein
MPQSVSCRIDGQTATVLSNGYWPPADQGPAPHGARPGDARNTTVPPFMTAPPAALGLRGTRPRWEGPAQPDPDPGYRGGLLRRRIRHLRRRSPPHLAAGRRLRPGRARHRLRRDRPVRRRGCPGSHHLARLHLRAARYHPGRRQPRRQRHRRNPLDCHIPGRRVRLPSRSDGRLCSAHPGQQRRPQWPKRRTDLSDN